MPIRSETRNAQRATRNATANGARSSRSRVPRYALRVARLRRGISLLEAVVAVAIVGLTSVGALEAVGGNMRTAEKARRAMVAEALATSRLDFMTLMTDRELQALPDSVAKGTFPEPLQEYSWTTTSEADSDQPGIYSVHVKINWTNGSYVIPTYLYRRPPLVTRR